MAIAGALAGFGAGLFYLSNVSQWNPLNSTSLPGMGFNGISVALLASSNPIGTVFSALFISHISVGHAVPRQDPEPAVPECRKDQCERRACACRRKDQKGGQVICCF